MRLPLPGDSQPLVLGQVLDGHEVRRTSRSTGKKNEPMMPVAWTKSYKVGDGQDGSRLHDDHGRRRPISPTKGARRMLVNACYWAIGLEDKIAAKSNVDIVGTFTTSPFSFNGFRKGLKPTDFAK